LALAMTLMLLGAFSFIPHAEKKAPTDLPVGSFCDTPVKYLAQKYFCFSEPKSVLYSPRPPHRGADRDRHGRDAGVKLLSFSGVTVARTPVHRGERGISRKPIACGNAG